MWGEMPTTKTNLPSITPNHAPFFQAEFYLFVVRFEGGLHETYEFEFNQLDTCGRDLRAALGFLGVGLESVQGCGWCL